MVLGLRRHTTAPVRRGSTAGLAVCVFGVVLAVWSVYQAGAAPPGAWQARVGLAGGVGAGIVLAAAALWGQRKRLVRLKLGEELSSTELARYRLTWTTGFIAFVAGSAWLRSLGADVSPVWLLPFVSGLASSAGLVGFVAHRAAENEALRLLEEGEATFKGAGAPPSLSRQWAEVPRWQKVFGLVALVLGLFLLGIGWAASSDPGAKPDTARPARAPDVEAGEQGPPLWPSHGR